MKNFLYLLLLLSFTANLSSQDLTTKDKPKTSKKERVYSAKYQYGIYAPDVIGKDFFKLFSTGKEKKKIFKDKRNGKSFEPVVIYSQVDDTLGEKVSLVYFKDECTQTYIANLFFESNACAILNSNNPNVLMCKALPKKAVLTFTFKKNNKTIESIIENSGASYYLYRPLYMTKDQKGFDLLSKVVMADPSFPKTNEEWVAAILLEVKWKAISETMDTMMDVINNYFSIIMSKELEKRNQEYLTKITNNQATLNSLTVGDLIQQVNPSYGYNNGFGAYTAFGYGEQSKDFCTYITDDTSYPNMAFTLSTDNTGNKQLKYAENGILYVWKNGYGQDGSCYYLSASGKFVDNTKPLLNRVSFIDNARATGDQKILDFIKAASIPCGGYNNQDPEKLNEDYMKQMEIWLGPDKL